MLQICTAVDDHYWGQFNYVLLTAVLLGIVEISTWFFLLLSEKDDIASDLQLSRHRLW